MTDKERLDICRYRLEQIQRCLELDEVNSSVRRLAQHTLVLAENTLRLWYRFAQPLVAADYIVKLESEKNGGEVDGQSIIRQTKGRAT